MAKAASSHHRIKLADPAIAHDYVEGRLSVVQQSLLGERRQDDSPR
ncbi:MAG: hypothetical protein AAGC93_08700 [Cyanobacteria bacterium P01_F01_bin.53]